MRRLDYPPVWLALFLLLAAALAGVTPRIGGAAGVAMGWIGWALVALALALTVWAALAFRRARTTIVPHRVPQALVTGGPYRFSRNPIYLADLMILAGLALILGAPAALALLAPFAWVLTTRFIKPEEARLDAAFGAAWRTYAARVRRWL